jgi:hypothetical protein
MMAKSNKGAKMPGGGQKMVAILIAGAALALGAAACSSDNSSNNPPPPPAAFGSVHDWGGGNTVTVSAPRDVQAPSLVPNGDHNVMVFDVAVHNGGSQPVALNSYGVDVAINGAHVSAAALNGYNTGQVTSNGGTATFTEVVEAPPAGGKVDVTVNGVNDQARPAVTFEGPSPTPNS